MNYSKKKLHAHNVRQSLPHAHIILLTTKNKNEK